LWGLRREVLNGAKGKALFDLGVGCGQI
jgi:hypothetical protein